MDEAAKNPSMAFPSRESTIVQASIMECIKSRCMIPNIKSISAEFPANE